jgi:hypothetical protein
MNTLPTRKYSLSPPPLEELVPIIQTGLSSNFKDVTVSLAPCPNLTLPPFHLAAPGLCGQECIADIGGVPNLHPYPNLDKKYDLLEITKGLDLGERGFALGAGAGPFHVVGGNCELMPNLSYAGAEVVNLTTLARIQRDETAVCEGVPGGSTECALMANLFGSRGLPGQVLKVTARGRTGKLNFPAAVQGALAAQYGERPVSLGGVFLIRKGKATLHVMPDFSKEPLEMGDAVQGWLRFFEMRAPLVCLTTFHSFDPGLDLRMEHTHCFSEHGEGGHYHFDTTPEEVEYEAYLNTAQAIYRIDRPERE